MDHEARKKKKAWKLQQKQAAQAAFPIPEDDLENLFEYLEQKLDTLGCDHTDRFTHEWTCLNEQPTEALLEWARENGGYCDCEVLANTYDHFIQNRRDT